MSKSGAAVWLVMAGCAAKVPEHHTLIELNFPYAFYPADCEILLFCHANRATDF